jgi:hypothetical protein
MLYYILFLVDVISVFQHVNETYYFMYLQVVGMSYVLSLKNTVVIHL